MSKNWPEIINGLSILIDRVGPIWPRSTKLAGFSAEGPFHCGNCEYLVGNRDRCRQKVMMADPEVQHDKNGLAIITDAEHQCCEFVEPVDKKAPEGPKLVALFMRHGQTEANKERRFRGAMEIPLDSVGRQQALDARRFLAGYLGDKSLGPAYTSSKDRAKETANIMLGPGRAKEIKDFDALNVGNFSGQKKTNENMKEILHYQNNPDQKIPGGERLNDFRARVNPNIKALIADGEKSGKPPIAVVHSSTIHQVSHLIHGDHDLVKVTPGGIVGIFKRPSGSYYVQALLNQSKGPQDQLMS